uniref:F-box domain-containing protein n=1 Tax=Aegilops tauschii TaxID=37682 RepID=M8ANU3_AEGTA
MEQESDALVVACANSARGLQKLGSDSSWNKWWRGVARIPDTDVGRVARERRRAALRGEAAPSAASTLQLPDDALREILLRVSADVAALFRCGITCKWWGRLIADRSFLRRCWPENAAGSSSLLGFFQTDWEKNQTPFFSPILPGSVFGSHRRSLTTFVSGVPAGVLNKAIPIAARHGLLLVRHTATGELVMCDTLAGDCVVLPPLKWGAPHYGYAILTREDCCPSDGHQGPTSPTGHSAFFKVLSIVRDARGYSLNTFMSSETGWSSSRKCFGGAWAHGRRHLRLILGTNKVVVCRGMAHWLGTYSADQGDMTHYFTLGVNAETGQISLADLPIPANQLAKPSYSGPMLSLDGNGRLSLLHLRNEDLRLSMWTRVDDGTWLRTVAIELKQPKQAWHFGCVRIWSGKKRNTLLITDFFGRIHETDIETGVMEDVTTKMFEDEIGTMAVPMEIDWPTLSSSRLSF